ncbi:MAG: hypothetical protein LLF75_11405 [Eubacteriales bacterium]|nr:hypothetical protein [Eubacteriales bacterium]
MKRFFAGLFVLILVLAQIGCAAPAADRSANVDLNTAPQVSNDVKEPPESGSSDQDAGVEIKNYDELVIALEDASVTKAHISESLTIAPTQEQTFEREGFLLTVDEGAEVMMENGFIPVFFGSEDTPGLVIDGTLKIAGTFDFGGITLLNNGMLEVLDGGTLAPGMSAIENHGTILVDPGGIIRLERGTGLLNFAKLANLGEIEITSDGGSLNNTSGATLENNGHITFRGDYQNEGTYTGTQQEP